MIGPLHGCGGGGVTNPSPPTYTGRWGGTTSQGLPISFVVSAENRLVELSIGYSVGTCVGVVQFSGISLEIAVSQPPQPPPFDAPGFTISKLHDGGGGTAVGGDFPTGSTAKGAFQFVAYPNCGTTGGTWTAAKR